MLLVISPYTQRIIYEGELSFCTLPPPLDNLVNIYTQYLVDITTFCFEHQSQTIVWFERP